MEWSKPRIFRMHNEGPFFFLENIGCQNLLIFTLYFLYKDANQWLVFNLIHYYYYLNWWKEQRLSWWRRGSIPHQLHFIIILKDLDKLLLWDWLLINLQPMPIHKERSLMLIYCSDYYCSLTEKNFNLIWPKPMSLKLPLKILKLWIK